MLDSTTIRAQLDTAINALTATLGDLFAAEMKRRQTTAPKAAAVPEAAPKTAAVPKAAKKTVPKAEGKEVFAPPKPKPVAEKVARAAAPKLKPLLGRANVHVVPSRTTASPVPARMASQYEPETRKGPPPEEIAKKAERLVMAASLPPTFERIRRALRVSKNALSPVIDQLVETKKICVVDVGGVILYKPPRIEPIRRRRVDRPVASGQGL